MQPHDPNDRRSITPVIPQRSSQPSAHIPSRDTTAQQGAASVARTQLNAIYNGQTATSTPQTTPILDNTTSSQPLETDNPYERTQTNFAHVQEEQWKHYHSAWQDYYQKYYERYYMGQVYQARQALEARVVEASRTISPGQPPEPSTSQETTLGPETFTKEEAMYELHKKILGKLQDSASKVRKSRHFIPITTAICVMLLFLFLQYNSILIGNVEAYVSPGNIDPANIIIDPSSDVSVGPEPRLIIPKINVDVPVDYNATPDYDSQMAAMQNGLAYFGIPGADSRPGQIGNTVLSGHSSNDITDQGDYKFIFAQLDKLTNGDTIYANYQGKRYTYTVTREQVVKPNDVSSLVYPTTKPLLTLITCTPLGTSLNRLLVVAEQVSPDPKTASPAPTSTGSSSQPTSIPGTSPTVIQRLFGHTQG